MHYQCRIHLILSAKWLRSENFCEFLLTIDVLKMYRCCSLLSIPWIFEMIQQVTEPSHFSHFGISRIFQAISKPWEKSSPFVNTDWNSSEMRMKVSNCKSYKGEEEKDLNNVSQHPFPQTGSFFFLTLVSSHFVYGKI